ncbi:endonuclease NucS domain-containing protein [Methanobacterium alcaliphilum]|uniref:endonuclease NucS domain-containing protein n=1 Tax=Methanobacterium alcaliphilum TaxID=392018 RepID=UPI00200B496B|nr:endonuclease NucS domain-containing protein [Methanobacterium alcaliphilum]MCK9150492.1 endonuclease NucS [Methanobacterium alcaliphilum]
MEAQLEEKLINDPSILLDFGYDVEKINRQHVIKDSDGKTRFLDLIFQDKNGKTIVIELKNVKATTNTYKQINNYLKSLKNYNIISNGIVIARGYEPDFYELINEREDIDFIDLEDLGFE